MHFVNLTPHALTVVTTSGETVSFPSEGVVRVESKTVEHHTVGLFAINTTSYGDVVGVPEFAEGVYYVVSRLVKSHPSMLNRMDIVCPGELIRDSNGVVVGCKGFSY